jgi:DNA-binding NarL/FixJ family response regulator
MKIHIGLVDDHQLFSKSLTLLINTFKDCEVILNAVNGKDLQEKFEFRSQLPNIMLVDVEMPVMNGLETTRWLKHTHPAIRVIALSMNAQEQIIIDMIKAGCCSYLLKETAPEELEHALHEVYRKSYYNSELSKSYLSTLMTNQEGFIQLSENEREFLTLACTELTYRQIAAQMNLTERTIDGYRESIFKKLNTISRTGMVLEAVRRGLVKI